MLDDIWLRQHFTYISHNSHAGLKLKQVMLYSTTNKLPNPATWAQSYKTIYGRNLRMVAIS
jgi:hypothetical protein